MKKICFFVFLFLVSFDLISALDVGASIPNKYQNVIAGERVYLEVGIDYPENTQMTNLRIEYIILDKNGNMISHSKLLKGIKSEVSFIDFVIIPTDTRGGDYSIVVNVRDSESLKKTANVDFSIISVNNSKITFLLFGLVILILLVSCLTLTLLVINKRQ